MQKSMKYKYSCRPGYGSECLMIEFSFGAGEAGFVEDLMDALKAINPQIINLSEMWVNDEMRYTLSSDLGPFQLDIDNWGFAFITADDNQVCILQIASLLRADISFQKIDVDFRKYELGKNH